jgi:D-alanyl-D-alanine carboxypeptidase (penicillin-binding protein 5/6)
MRGRGDDCDKPTNSRQQELGERDCDGEESLDTEQSGGEGEGEDEPSDGESESRRESENDGSEGEGETLREERGGEPEPEPASQPEREPEPQAEPKRGERPAAAAVTPVAAAAAAAAEVPSAKTAADEAKAAKAPAAVVASAAVAPAAAPATAARSKRRLAQPLARCAAAFLCVVIAIWASLATSGPHTVVPAADSTGSVGSGAGAEAGATAGAVTTPPPAPKTLAQTIASTYTIPGGAPSLAWPSRGQAAVDVLGMGSLGTYGSTSTPVPIASVTKTMVAYVILTGHPISSGESGPTITVSAAEAAAYPAEHALGQSLVLVKAGEQLTERQALEALMLASADNVAEILARWDAGSVSAFVAKMNVFAVKLGMSHTTYTDPSGYTPSTVSTAVDQMTLGEAAMQLPAFSTLVGESSATIPVQGTIINYNKLLGDDGVTGIKTGSTDQAGGCLLFSATFTVGGTSETIVGVVLGQYLGTGSSFLDNTLYAAQKLIKSAEAAVVSSTIAAPGTQVAAIQQAGAADVPLGVSSPVSVVGLVGTTYQVSVSGSPSAATLTLTATGTTGSTSPLASASLVQIVASSGTASPGTGSSAAGTSGAGTSGTAYPGAVSSGTASPGTASSGPNPVASGTATTD